MRARRTLLAAVIGLAMFGATAGEAAAVVPPTCRLDAYTPTVVPPLAQPGQVQVAAAQGKFACTAAGSSSITQMATSSFVQIYVNGTTYQSDSHGESRDGIGSMRTLDKTNLPCIPGYYYRTVNYGVVWTVDGRAWGFGYAYSALLFSYSPGPGACALG